MGVLLTVKSADFSGAAIGFAAPVTANLEFWNYYGDSSTKLGRNLVVGKPAPAVSGAPVAGAGFHTFTGMSNFLTTGLNDAAEVTLLCVARAPNLVANQYAYLIGDYTSDGTVDHQGSSLLFNSASNPVQATPGIIDSRSVSGVDTQSNVNLYGQAYNNVGWAFYAGRMGAAFNRIDDKTHGLNAAGAVTSPRSAPSGIPYRIGSAYVAGVGLGVADIAYAGLYSRCLTDNEIASVYAKVQAYLATRSIAI